MKISILLPYKENFSPIYPGAVSLFVRDTVKLSKYRKNITIYGNGSQTRSFCYVSDLIQGLIKLMDRCKMLLNFLE